MPTLGVAVAKVVEITSSSEDPISTLAHFVLADVALTQKILRLSNTIYYRKAGGVPVTTVSRAIYLLGFNTVKTSAMAMLLVDGFGSKRQAQSVRQELIHSLCASIMASELGRHSRFPDAEEASVAALFKNIGKILVASFDHRLQAQIQTELKAEPEREQEVVSSLLGCSYQRFGESVLQEWKIPDVIIQSLHALPAGELKKATHRSEWLRQVVSFSDEVAALLVHSDLKEKTAQSMIERCAPLLRRYGKCLEINQATLEEMLRRVDNETRQLADSMDIAVNEPWTDLDLELGLGDAGAQLGNEFTMQSFATDAMQQTQCHPSGKPINARDRLLAGVQDVTQMLASDTVKLHDMFLLVLETLYASLGFRFATVCLRDQQHSRYIARVSVGELYSERQKGFVLASAPEDSVFHLAMSNNSDLMIADARLPKIQNLLPLWHKNLFPDTRSFMVLPLVVQNKPLGFFYADRASTAEEGVPPDEAALIRTLKSQLIAVMMRK
ncbi:MAG: HDOD domain-containing protein [Burkholderiaceae bacterium]|nr:HDOD domain-containing protein [Burkholderiaceae bacterium]